MCVEGGGQGWAWEGHVTDPQFLQVLDAPSQIPSPVQSHQGPSLGGSDSKLLEANPSRWPPEPESQTTGQGSGQATLATAHPPWHASQPRGLSCSFETWKELPIRRSPRCSVLGPSEEE